MASMQMEELKTVVEDGDYVDCCTENNPDLENEGVTEDRRVVNDSEIGDYSDYGLGLGVDATDCQPWTNKKTFRARHVTRESVLGIKGGILRAFNEKVTSIREFQSSMKASVPTNDLLSVGIDAEASRSYSVQRRSIGKKIISRTIAFKSEFKNIPHERVETDFGESQPSFESRLTGFIKERTKKRVESLSVETLTDLCFQFVENGAVTHYVHSIELGACHYRTMSEEEFVTVFGASANVGVKEMAEIALKNTATMGTHRFQSEDIKIGQIRKRDCDQNEEVGVERVVGLKFQSISSLVVDSATLREAMENAVSMYISKKEDCKFGPFHISCYGSLFLKVESHNQLKTTDRLEDASQFSIIRCKQGDEHFNIVYQPPDSGNGIAVPSLFLSASKHGVPLLMRDTVSKSKLALRSTSTERFERPENLSDWISGVGREFFYIICKEVRKTVGGKRYYLCVFKPSADGLEEQEYVTGCKLREDRDNPDTHMLFSLIKPRKPKPHPDDNEFVLTPTEGPKDKIVEEGQQLGLTLNKIPKDKISKVGDQIPSERPEDKITEEGPFFVTTNFGSGEENIYFRVKDCNICATTTESEASRFYIRYEQGSHFFRVNLYFETSSSTATTSDKNINNKLERSCFVTQISGTSMEWCVDPNLHLTAVVSNRNCPLQLQHRDTNNQSYGYLAICEQKSQSSDPEEVESVEPERWFQEGNKAFYVRCSAKPDQATTSGNFSYLCVRRKVGCYRRRATYSTGCVPSIKHHNRKGRSMLFKLVRASESGPKEIHSESEMLQNVI